MSATRTIDDIPDDEIQRAMDYMGAVVHWAPSRTASHIASILSEECLLAGESSVSHTELERRTRTCRRTVQRNLKALISGRLIACIRRVDGRSTYRCCWERGAEFRREREERLHGRK